MFYGFMSFTPTFALSTVALVARWGPWDGLAWDFSGGGRAFLIMGILLDLGSALFRG